jgi:hypoxanthine-DNA glycosylase
MQKQCFDPVVDKHVRLLVLGSLPGDVSLAQKQYYGHPQNQFWRLMSAVMNADLPTMDYPARLQTLLKNGVGLWDVIATARREGSLDSNIQQQANNDLVGLIGTLPALTAIAFNGGTAARHGVRLIGERVDSYRIITLPSSSPAYTLPFTEKLIRWQTLNEFI